MRSLTRQDLNRIGCSNPNCTHENDDILHLHAGCHVWSPLEVSYEKRTGKLTIECAECEQPVAIIEVR